MNACVGKPHGGEWIERDYLMIAFVTNYGVLRAQG
jgi:hypothetical protein